MDFARRQMEKYGWTDGKGLGKHENGISEALKPKLKRSVTGIGHDPASEFNEHWWNALYDKAAKNVEVEEKNGKTKKIKTIDTDDFTITNSTWRINKKSKNVPENEYSDYFIKKAVLAKGGSKVESVGESEMDDEESEKKDVFKMTDEELFAACEGRTAHKGARHGLRALGKLARIAQQEQMLLTQSKYEGYSHAKKLKQKSEDIIEDTSLEDVCGGVERKSKKKKKRKRCFSNENDGNTISEQAESDVPLLEDLKSKEADGGSSGIKEGKNGRKSKKADSENCEVDVNENVENDKKSKKKEKRKLVAEESDVVMEPKDEDITEECTEKPIKTKKKKKRNQEL